MCAHSIRKVNDSQILYIYILLDFFLYSHLNNVFFWYYLQSGFNQVDVYNLTFVKFLKWNKAKFGK